MTEFIIYHNDRILVAQKPTGIHTHPSELSRGEMSFQEELERQIGQKLYTLHRLDRATSGLLVFALTPDAARFYQHQFALGRVEKTYLALVRGWLGSTRTDRPIRDELREKKLPAVTVFDPLYFYRVPVPVGPYPELRLSWVKAIPETGRRHQIRLHAHQLSHPIVGDGRHGDHRVNKAVNLLVGQNRMWLHAQTLRLPLENEGGEMIFESTWDLLAELTALEKWRLSFEEAFSDNPS